MWHALQNRVLRVLTLVLLFVGGTFSIAGILNDSGKGKPTIVLSENKCQIQSAEAGKQCTAQSNEHSDAATNTNHCQKHCGHCSTWITSQQNCLSPNIVMSKVANVSNDSPSNVTLDPGFRPPNR